MTTTSFTPDSAVTGVGSLPIGEPERAVAFVAQHAPEVPFWPQLPVRSPTEGMVHQALGVDASLVTHHDDGRLTVDPTREQELADQLADNPVALQVGEAAGFGAFIRALHRGKFKQARALKGHIAGPLTVGMALSIGDRPVIEDPVRFTAVIQRIARRAAWQAHTLADHGLPAIVVVDEPVLAMVDILEADANPLEPVLAAITAEGAIAGIHCCATGDIAIPSSPSLGLVSLDLHDIEHLTASVGRLWAGGGILAAGLVPTADDPDHLPTAARMATAWLELAAPVPADVGELAARTLVTASCGLAGVTERAAEASFDRATELTGRLRRLEGGTYAAGGAVRR